ncbi:MAG: ROK family protein [Actinobacteria bacterium]|nr:ROK family protein [Actinomycetota bacterium]
MPTVGIDVGGTNIKAGLVSESGEVLAVRRIPTPRVAWAMGDAINDVAEELVALARAPVTAVGLAVAALVEQPGGYVHLSVNTKLPAGQPAEALSLRLGLPVVVDNDANAAAFAEHRLGAAREHRNAVLITMGTGIGGGVVVDGELMRGGRGLGAELGHVVVQAEGPPCPGRGCRNRGCIESYVGARALTRTVKQACVESPGGAIARAIADGEPAGPELLGRLAGAGDPQAVSLLREAGDMLGVALVSVANVLAPEIIVIGGGLAGLGDLMLASTRMTYRQRVLAPFREALIVTAALGPDAGLIGAALLAAQRTA